MSGDGSASWRRAPTRSELTERLMSPIGLDIGARTPEETAVAICAEIIAVRTGRAEGCRHAAAPGGGRHPPALRPRPTSGSPGSGWALRCRRCQ